MSKKSQKDESKPVEKKQESTQPIGERVAVLETKLEKPVTQEELYHARVELYEKNVAIRKAKREKLEKLQKELGEDI